MNWKYKKECTILYKAGETVRDAWIFNINIPTLGSLDSDLKSNLATNNWGTSLDASADTEVPFLPRK